MTDLFWRNFALITGVSPAIVGCFFFSWSSGFIHERHWFLCLHRKFQSWNFLQVQTHLMRPWALQGPFREPQSQAVLWIEKSHINFGQAEKTASMPDTIQMFSDQVSLCPAYNANRGRPSLQPSFPAPWQRGPWIVALKKMRSGDQRWWPQMGPGWEQHWWKNLETLLQRKGWELSKPARKRASWWQCLSCNLKAESSFYLVGRLGLEPRRQYLRWPQ